MPCKYSIPRIVCFFKLEEGIVFVFDKYFGIHKKIKTHGLVGSVTVFFFSGIILGQLNGLREMF